MRILLTGATGYIGRRLLPVLLEAGHEVICCVRSALSFEVPEGWEAQASVFEVDFLKPVAHANAPKEFDAAYYLIHSLSAAIDDFSALEERAARNFSQYVSHTSCMQVIYLTGIVNSEELSSHLESRLQVERILDEGPVPLTALRAGIIIGSGSASFEIIRDLVEKLPVMVAPRWLSTRCQPIAIRDVIAILTGVLMKPAYFGENLDIGGPEVLTYRQMLLGYARARGLKRSVFIAPVMTPRLSSYWLYFVTSTTYELAVNLVNSMKVDVICRPNTLGQDLGLTFTPYEQAVALAFDKIQQNMVVSSWKDSLISSSRQATLNRYIEVPTYGCFVDEQQEALGGAAAEAVWSNIIRIGGERGWYYGNALWRLRGYLDKLAGGIGLRRGRTHPDRLHPGDALDFWRVLVADEQQQRLLLYAEMKLPGEAWLEFRIRKGEMLIQRATFRPSGLLGRLYWMAVLPFHFFVFKGMARAIVQFREKK